MIALLSYGTVSLADSPVDSSVLVAAVMWLQDVLLGTAATLIAVVAIAAIGFGMLTGRINIRHGVTVILGCFVLFGASSIVNGLRGAASGGYTDAPPFVEAPLPPTPWSPPTPPQRQPCDHYAGASVPVR